QPNVNNYLVTVEVGFIRRTHQQVQLDGLTCNQLRLKSLNLETVKRRGTVQQYRVLTYNLREDIPHYRRFPLDHFLGGFNGGRQAAMLELAEDKGLEQLQCHFLGQTALVQAQRGTYHNYGTAGIVHPLTQQVLTETTLDRKSTRL